MLRISFNRITKTSVTQFTSGHTTYSGAMIEIETEIRNYFICWPDVPVLTSGSGGFQTMAGDIGLSAISADQKFSGL
jgi:hypothetical protein